MRSLYFLALLFFLVNHNGFANNTDLKSSLSGTVKDAVTQLPLTGAYVLLPELKQSTTTDANGNYSFSGLPNGTLTLQVSYVGYKSVVVNISVKGNTHFDFILHHSVVENENVTVTGVSSAIRLKRTPVQVSILSQKAIQQSLGLSLLQTVSKEPGVSIVTTGPAIAKPFIRGLGYNRVVTVNDGIRQEGQQWGDEHGLEIDEYSVHKVEVLRGPASLMYGSDAIGGVINILTNTQVANNTIQANLQSTYSGNNRMFGQYANVAGNKNGFNWNAYGSIKSAGDYKNKYDGNVLNSRFGEKNFGGYLGLNRSWGFTHLVFSSYNQKMGMVEGERNAAGDFLLDGTLPTNDQRNSRTPLDPWQQVNHWKLALDNSFSLENGGRISAQLGFQRNQRKEFGHDHGDHDHGDHDHDHDADHDHDHSVAEGPSAYFDLQTINYNLAYHVPVWRNWKTSFGVNGMRQQNENKAEEAIIPNYNLFDIGVFGVTAKTWNQFTLTGGMRYDLRSLNSKALSDHGEEKFTAFSKSFANFSASLGGTYTLNDHVAFKANMSRGFRAPNLSELAANGSHEGTNRYEIGSRNLRSELSTAFDASVEISTDHVEISVAPYFNHISNYIFLNRLQAGNGTDSLIDGAMVYQFNQQSARLMGVEARFDVHPHPLDWLHFENRISFVRGRFTRPVDGSYNLPLIAPASLFTELRGELPKFLRGFTKAYAKVEMNWVTTQNHFFSGYATETATSGYVLFNAGIGTDVKITRQNKISIMLGINNIGDVAYQSHLSRLKYTDTNPLTGRTGVFNMGRNFMARIIIPFEWKV